MHFVIRRFKLNIFSICGYRSCRVLNLLRTEAKIFQDLFNKSVKPVHKLVIKSVFTASSMLNSEWCTVSLALVVFYNRLLWNILLKRELLTHCWKKTSVRHDARYRDRHTNNTSCSVNLTESAQVLIYILFAANVLLFSCKLDLWKTSHKLDHKNEIISTYKQFGFW